MKYLKIVELVRKGHIFNDPDILKLSNEYGWTIAHEQTVNDWVTNAKEILKLSNDIGWSEAHKMAERNWNTNDIEILKLRNKYGETVAHILAKANYFRNAYPFKWKKILLLKNNDKIYVFCNYYKKPNLNNLATDGLFAVKLLKNTNNLISKITHPTSLMYYTEKIRFQADFYNKLDQMLKFYISLNNYIC
ncbi:hypothetical protein DEFDS_P115 (plasmid) [Deferribacter desulfuricans SSM1]|uniref:Ankyrin repeat protein n=1 Tax=Deferribacter desulfuricans (strain DSM 14783 / JCM 11476 / NBRC 101012 / SSM1) TaxID=639282 RepID=D3PEU5_DEFDS|nr:hypothetical protein [Deferribacter desulfuricans]BAI81737.1 hypothetical protein DEFDS_P115 [Deferribacter desulfuricans SSM1]